MKRRIVVVAVVLVCASVLSALAQSPLAFEAASIKQVDSSIPGISVRGLSCHGSDGATGHPQLVAATGLGRCRVLGLPLLTLISNSFAVGPDRVLNGPSWISSLPYTIEAKAESETTTRSQLMQMMKTMLLDRFSLKFHMETREVSGYALVVAKGGSRLKEAPPEQPRGTATMPVAGQMTMSGQMSAAGIAGSISRRLGVPVSDETGLTGAYLVDLKWSPSENEVGGTATASDPAGPSIFTALQEQLGLRLEPRKATIEVMVIDSVAKATEN